MRKSTNKALYTPEQLWEAACGYFQWVEDNPLWETKSYMYLGQAIHDEVPKMRVMTFRGLSLFLDVTERTLYKYMHRDEYREVMSTISNVIYDQKFTAAAADLINANLIARDLGMKDLHVHEHTGADGGPIASITANMDPVEASRMYRELLLGPVKQIE